MTAGSRTYHLQAKLRVASEAARKCNGWNQKEKSRVIHNYREQAKKSEMAGLQGSANLRDPAWYACDFVNQLRLDSGIQQKCERTCLLWSKDHWANEAKKAQMNLRQSKEGDLSSPGSSTKGVLLNAQFLNTVAQVYGKIFGFQNEFCNEKNFSRCPYQNRQKELLRTGSLARVFVTILHKATMSVMRDRHGIDSGFFDEEYDDVYGVDLTNFHDLEASLQDGRFARLYETALKRAKQLAGMPWYSLEPSARTTASAQD